MFPACRFWSQFDHYRRLPPVIPARVKWRLIRAGPSGLAWPPGTQRRCGQVMMMRLMARFVHGGPAAAVVLAVVLAVAVGVAGPAAGSVSGSARARTGPGQATAIPAGALVISAAQRAGGRPPVRGFPDRSILPADAVLAGISCVSASFCLAVGGYADALGRRHSLAEKWNGSRWLVVPGARGTGLSGVSCTSARFCMAVGSPAQRWDGRRWTAARTPRGLRLVGISCTRRSFCMAVGSGESRDGFACESAAAWNGTRWRAFPVLDPCAVEIRGFTRVSCVSASMCMAVGASLDPDSKEDVALAEEWNGRKWQELATPAVAASSELSDVSCLTATFCMAVGSEFIMVTAPCTGTCILALTWNGSTWQQAGTPGNGGLSAVSCVNAASCVAVSGSQAMAWDGTAWTPLMLAQPGTARRSLPGIACLSGTACMAAGAYSTSDGASLPLAEQWNGSTWRVRRTPGPGDAFNGLSGVSCTSAARCMAVGNRINDSDVQVTLAERWDGRRWLVLPAPSPGPNLNVLNGISCPTAANCMAVGYYYDAAGNRQALAEQWNGASWTTLAIPHNGALRAVSCPAASRCMAVGSYLSLSPERTHTLTATWDGTAWTVRPSPDLSRSITELTGVSCTGSSNCIAVGDDDSGGGPLHPLSARWNGTAWQVLATPIPGGAGGLTSVSCPRPASCMAVGTTFPRTGHAFPARTLAESWNGSRWRVRATPAIRGQLRPLLTAVSCPRPARCIAVGGYFSPSGKAFVLAEAWNGTGWRRLFSIRSPDPAFNYLYGVSCPAAARCIAAGEQGIQLTSAYRWDGARWRMLRPRNP